MPETVWSLVPKGGFGFKGSRSDYEPPLTESQTIFFNTRSKSKLLSDLFQMNHAIVSWLEVSPPDELIVLWEIHFF